MDKRSISARALALLGLALFPLQMGCGQTEVPATTLAIGAVLDRTGSLAAQSWVESANLAAADANAALELSGRAIRFKVQVSDSTNTPKVASQRAIELVQQKGVLGIVTDSSQDDIALNTLHYDADATNDLKVPIVCMACTSPAINNPAAVNAADPVNQAALRNGLRWNFRTLMDAMPQAKVFVRIAQSKAQLGDFNGDGRLDVVTGSSISAVLAVALGRGDGTFGTPNLMNLPGPAIAVSAGDFNGDGRADLLVVFSAANSVYFYPGLGTGLFGTPTSIALAGVPSSIAVTDVTRDGLPDAMIPTYLGRRLHVLRSLVGQSPTRISTDYYPAIQPANVVLSDVDNDGRSDLVISNKNSTTAVALYGDKGGIFAESRQIDTGSLITGFGLYDVDRNGLLDLLIPYQSTSISIFSSFAGRIISYSGKIEYSYPEPIAYLPYLRMADVNRDGLIDMVTLGSNDVHVFLMNSTGNFDSALSFSIRLETPRFATGLRLGDMNHDGVPDIVTVDSAGAIGLLTGIGDGTFNPVIFTQVAPNPSLFVIEDVDQDGRGDLIMCIDSTNQLVYLREAGNGTFAQKFSVPTNGRCTALTVGDLNGDNRNDIVVAEGGLPGVGNSNIVVIQKINRDVFMLPARYQIEAGVSSIDVVDTNDDGRNDLIVGNTLLRLIRTLYNQSM